MEDTEDDSSGLSSSTSSGLKIFRPQARPLILELHDIRKDDPSKPSLLPSDSISPIGATDIKIRKHKKGKKKAESIVKSGSSASSASLSETSSVAPSATDVKEEFYDARESYHAIPENQIPVALAARMIAQSDTNQDLAKAPELAAATSVPQTTTEATETESFPVIKPIAPP